MLKNATIAVLASTIALSAIAADSAFHKSSVELADAIGRALAAGDATVGHPRSPGGERIDVV